MNSGMIPMAYTSCMEWIKKYTLIRGVTEGVLRATGRFFGWRADGIRVSSVRKRCLTNLRSEEIKICLWSRSYCHKRVSFAKLVNIGAYLCRFISSVVVFGVLKGAYQVNKRFWKL